jgi:hypothetical protein
MGETLTSYFGKRRHALRQENIFAEILIGDWFPTSSARLGQERGSVLGIRVQLFRPELNTSSPNIVPTPTSPTSHISTGAQPSEVLKAAKQVQGYGCQQQSASRLHSIPRTSVKLERTALQSAHAERI